MALVLAEGWKGDEAGVKDFPEDGEEPETPCKGLHEGGGPEILQHPLSAHICTLHDPSPRLQQPVSVGSHGSLSQ